MSEPIYRIERHEHGFLVFGAIPVEAMRTIVAMGKAERFELMDAGVAAAAEATLAITNKKGSKAWRALLDERAKSSAQGDAELAWLRGTDTGISSKTIFSVLSTKHGHLVDLTSRHWRPDVPHDPDDFGRCYRLLRAIPAWRSRLDRVAERHKVWAPMVREWDRMTALYERDLPTGRCKELYDLMHELEAEGRR